MYQENISMQSLNGAMYDYILKQTRFGFKREKVSVCSVHSINLTLRRCILSAKCMCMALPMCHRKKNYYFPERH
jgi:hypothetical protein